MTDDPVEFNCPHCNQLYKLTTAQLQRYAGRQTNCRKCQQPFEFPAPPAEAEPQETYEEQFAEQAGYPEASAMSYSAPAAPPPPPPPAEPMAASARQQSIDYRRPSRARPKPTVMDFLLFRGMVTPVVIQVIFWLGVIASIYVGAMMIHAALNPPPLPQFGYGGLTPTPGSTNTGLLILGLVYAILGPIVVRVYCELIIVIFRILDALRDVADTLEERLPRS